MATILNEEVTLGRDNTGKHINGGEVGGNGNVLNTEVTRNESPNLLKDDYDADIVKMGFTNGYINALTRSTGYKQTKSMRYGYFSIDLRKGDDAVAQAVNSVTADQARGNNGAKVTIKVNNARIFDLTDQIMFKGVSGWAKNDDGSFRELEHMSLNGLVRKVDTTANEIEVQLINGNVTTTIPANTPIYVLGHAAAELDAASVPYSALPTDRTQYMQKFMVQSLVGNVMLESDKNANWDREDIDEILLQQFITDVERSYIFGAKGYMFDDVTRMWTYTTSGIIEQILENGGKVMSIPKNKFDDKQLLDMVSEVFVGNSGSNTRYIFTGNGFTNHLFSLPNIVKYQNVNDVVRSFEYDFKRLRVMNYTLLNASHPMLDMMGYTDAAIIIDKQYLQRRVFRSLKETELALETAGVLDAKSTVWCEISSVILKYPQCHMLVILEPAEEEEP